MMWNRMTGPYALVVLDADRDQRRDAAAALVQAGAPEHRRCCSCCRCSSTSACGSSASSSSSPPCTATSCPRRGSMYYADALGLHDCSAGTIGLFLTLFFLFVRVRADDFDLRSADAAAGGQGEGEHGRLMAHTTLKRPTRCYGLMAEFDIGQALVDAARKTRGAGLHEGRRVLAVPIEELNDIIHKTRTHAAEAGPGRRPHRHGDRLRAAVLGVGDRVPDEHRRPPAARAGRRSSCRPTS